MSILDSIALDKEFATFEDIEKTIKELETVLCYPLHFGDAKTIVAYNKSVSNYILVIKVNAIHYFFLDKKAIG